jgi:N-sulfoglucosamine sulfohydrolase
MSPNRRKFIQSSAAAGGAAWLAGSQARAGSERPNILWLVSEDNTTLLGCYGDRFARTPNLDRLAGQGVRFTNCFANAPVCAPARFTIHTGIHACSAGNEPMRSTYPLPAGLQFFTHHLRAAGYYCVNGSKTDYNTTGTPPGAWDGRKLSASLKGLARRQPFFRFINYMTTHESSLHKTRPLTHDPADLALAPYHPDTPEVRHDYAQYYDQINIMDGQIEAALAELEREGLADSTIVLYFSDNGGVLPRSKRFLYDTGVHVPLIVRVPPRFAHRCPWSAGEAADRLVSYVDFAPTMLSLAGLDPPDYMEGRAFLGEKSAPARDHVFVFRGRMDEQTDLSRGVRDARFKYIRNYFPHLAWGRGLAYLYRMPAMQSWAREYEAGRLDPVQRRFFEPKPMEELYDVASDPWEIDNLAAAPEHAERLARMRELLRGDMLALRDAGLLHEVELLARAEAAHITPYELVRDPARYDLAALMAAADLANQRDPGRLSELIVRLADPDSGVRYWAAIGLSALAERAAPAAAALATALGDSSAPVSIAAAEALAKSGDPAAALPVLERHLRSPNMYEAAYAADAAALAGLASGPLKKLVDGAHKKLSTKTGLNALR